MLPLTQLENCPATLLKICSGVMFFKVQQRSLALLLVKSTWIFAAYYPNISSNMSGFVAASHSWKMSWWLVSNIQWFHAKKCWNTLLNTGLWLGLKIPGFLLQTTAISRQKYVVLSPHTAGNCPVQWFHAWKYSILNSGLSRGSKTYLLFWCTSSVSLNTSGVVVTRLETCLD